MTYRFKSKLLICKDVYFSTIDVIKIHGTLRVGSNYLQKLLDANFHGRILLPEEYGWKHGKIKYSRNVKYIIMAKDPFAWVLSFWKWERLHGRSNSQNVLEFVGSKMTHHNLESEWRLTDVIAVWNESYKYWINYLQYHNVALVRYEDIISHFDESMGSMRASLNLKAKKTPFVNITNRADNWKKPNLQEPLTVDFYRNKQYMSVLGEEAVSLIKLKLDKEVLVALGYHDDMV